MTHAAPYRCTNTWYAGVYRCFDEEEKEVEEEGLVEEQTRKKEEEERKGGEKVQQYLGSSDGVEGRL